MLLVIALPGCPVPGMSGRRAVLLCMPSCSGGSASGARRPTFSVKLSAKDTIELDILLGSMEQAESSTAAARKALHANINGASPDYELPWFVCPPDSEAQQLTKVGLRNIGLFSSMTSSVTQKRSSDLRSSPKMEICPMLSFLACQELERPRQFSVWRDSYLVLHTRKLC